MPPEGPALDSLRCPHDGGALGFESDGLLCSECHTVYPVFGGIPDFVTGAPAHSPRWQTAQSYELDYWKARGPDTSASEQARWATAASGLADRYDEIAGHGWRERVLHVGPAGHGEIHHLPALERWAVEPLAVELDRAGLLDRGDVRWVAAMGESMPFPDGWFSAAVLPNVIDHVADPARLLAELRRCLSPDSPAWITSHVSHPVFAHSLALLSRTRMGYFAGHPWQFTPARLRALVSDAGFRIVADHTGRAVDAAEVTTWRGRIKGRVLAARYLLVLA